MEIAAIIQARMGSSRLPGKVLMDLAGETMLDRVISRCLRASSINEVIVATTMKTEDDAIEKLCKRRKINIFRGSENDLLDRYYQAATKFKANIIVRITADCPIIDPGIIDKVVSEFLNFGPLDHASNDLGPQTYPHGLGVEVMSFDALRRAWVEDNNYLWREHVTPYFFRNPGKFRLFASVNDKDFSSYRLTVDTMEDFCLMEKIYNFFRHDNFTWLEAIDLLEKNPEWKKINQWVEQKKIP